VGKRRREYVQNKADKKSGFLGMAPQIDAMQIDVPSPQITNARNGGLIGVVVGVAACGKSLWVRRQFPHLPANCVYEDVHHDGTIHKPNSTRNETSCGLVGLHARCFTKPCTCEGWRMCDVFGIATRKSIK